MNELNKHLLTVLFIFLIITLIIVDFDIGDEIIKPKKQEETQMSEKTTETSELCIQLKLQPSTTSIDSPLSVEPENKNT